jgi:dipeptide/tripeptide permease
MTLTLHGDDNNERVKLLTTPTPTDLEDHTVNFESKDNNNSSSFSSALMKWFIFLQYPYSIWFIVGNELAERFAFYSFKSILPKYLKDYLLFSEDHATALVHAFIFLAYFTPILGGFLADAILGKFWTIVILSLVYCIGQITMSVTAIPSVTNGHWWGCALSLILVAFGTGGIKPCVSSFGGDQYVV